MSKSTDKVVISALWSAGCGSHGGCGCEIYVKDGRVTKVEGDRNHPFNQGRLCPKGLAIPQYMYHPHPVLYPLKRPGPREAWPATPVTPRGWVPCSPPRAITASWTPPSSWKNGMIPRNGRRPGIFTAGGR